MRRAPPLAAAAAALFVPLAFRILKNLLRKAPVRSCEGKCVLITGCDSGFGQSLAHAARDAGFSVVAACFTEDGARRFDGHDRVSSVVADLRTTDGRARVVAAAHEAAGACGLYALVNNAGLCLPGNVEWLPMSAYERSMDLNFHAPVALTHALLPELKVARGRVINVTSVDGFLALPTNAAYNASKHALEAFSDTLRCEMLPWKVGVVVIEPATMRTPLAMSFADGWLAGFMQADELRKAPYGEEWAADHAATSKETLDSVAADPLQTVTQMMRALTLADPPARITTGWAAKLLFKPLSLLPDKARDKTLYALLFPKKSPLPVGLRAAPYRLPPANVVSHVTIRVRSLDASVQWYEKWGFAPVGPAVDGQQFFQSGQHAKWQPYLLLLEDPAMRSRGPSYNAGMARLAVCVRDLEETMRRLSTRGLEPMAPPAGERAGRIAAYKDPDGFVVYAIVFFAPLAPLVAAARWWYGVGDPQLFHWTVNVEHIETALETFDALGFKPVYDAKPHQVQDDMLPAFGLSAETTKIRHIRLAKLPNDSFLACIMEWVEPRTTRTGSETLNCLTIAVDDVAAALRTVSRLGLQIEPPRRHTFPALGEAVVGTCIIDGGSRVEFVRYLHLGYTV